MYDGNQVLRFESKYKAKDLGGLGVELTQRKGTGNYDKDRTEFNYSFVPLTKPTLQEQVYSKLKENKIYYNDGKNTNLLNGAIVTSGKEFFQSLGMKFKASDRIQQVGKDKGKPIYIPDIKSHDDIPEKVKDFFKDSYNFLEELVGKDNIVYAEVHYDEDTPHMHFYFMPIVDEVRRKVFETDSNGNIIYREGIDKKGNKKMYPVQKKDENGKNIFKVEQGKFLNCDQFWKALGGKVSYAKIQDDYNKYITEKGYKLFRGNIGDNKHHITKAKKEIEDIPCITLVNFIGNPYRPDTNTQYVYCHEHNVFERIVGIADYRVMSETCLFDGLLGFAEINIGHTGYYSTSQSFAPLRWRIYQSAPLKYINIACDVLKVNADINHVVTKLMSFSLAVDIIKDKIFISKCKLPKSNINNWTETDIEIPDVVVETAMEAMRECTLYKTGIKPSVLCQIKNKTTLMAYLERPFDVNIVFFKQFFREFTTRDWGSCILKVML